MPVTKRGIPVQETQSAAKRRRTNRIQFLDDIGYIGDNLHTIFRWLPEGSNQLKQIINKEIGSFLNGNGGILCFGCRPSGRAYGMPLNRKEMDNLRLMIDDSFKKFHPFFPPEKYRMTFTQVEDRSQVRSSYVLEIKVSPGDHILFEDENHEVYVRKNGCSFGPLTPHEIKDRVTAYYHRQLSPAGIKELKPESNHHTPEPRP